MLYSSVNLRSIAVYVLVPTICVFKKNFLLGLNMLWFNLFLSTIKLLLSLFPFHMYLTQPLTIRPPKHLARYKHLSNNQSVFQTTHSTGKHLSAISKCSTVLYDCGEYLSELHLSLRLLTVILFISWILL